MYVVKRDGTREAVSFDKITTRIRTLAADPPLPHVDPVIVAQKVVSGVYDGVHTDMLDNLAAEEAAYMSTQHPNYGILAARIAVSNLHKATSDDWMEVVDQLHAYINKRTGLNASLIAEDVYEAIKKNIDKFNAAIDYKRDYNYDYFGFKTLQRSYLMKIDGKIVERPQHMLMRVSVGIHKDDPEKAIETYNLMSQLWFTHASPTLFNSGTPNHQLSSCFLLTMKDDSIEGIYETLKTCALISKSAGGIGLNVHKIRCSGSYIRGTNGNSNGLIPMLRVFNDTARYVDQGGAKRPGAFAIYLEPWHADIFDFLDLRKNHGKEEQRARDLFYALWIPDLFMRRVKENGKWCLFCPNECPGLSDCYGEEFEQLYMSYEQQGKELRKVDAQDLWFAILESQIETGNPYMLYKDSANAKSNHKHLGTIKCSNLCTEIIEYSAPDEVAVCNLASIALPRFVDEKGFNHQKLYEVTKVVTRNLNKIIDINKYPVEEARRSNMRHRPIGLGVQGLADVFMKLRIPFESEAAKVLNRDIFETIYFAALTASCELAAKDGHYETYPGSPVSQGILQFDMWGVDPSDRWDWASLRRNIREYGVRNSLLLAPMPTASTSQILGNNECFEPYTSNLYTRRVLAGEFTVVNKYLVEDLLKLGLWTPQMRNKIIAERGSVQDIDEIPRELKDVYKTVWEIKQRTLIDMAADRAAFIDQSQSLNMYIGEPTYAKLTSMHFHAWEKGLKTGMYYLRTQPAAKAIQFTVDQQQLKESLSTGDKDKNTTAASPMKPSPKGLIAKKRRLSGTPKTEVPAAPQEEIYGEVCTMKEGCIMCSG